MFGMHYMSEIEEIVEYLYANNYKEEANVICNLYGEYGEYRLESLYYNNNK